MPLLCHSVDCITIFSFSWVKIARRDLPAIQRPLLPLTVACWYVTVPSTPIIQSKGSQVLRGLGRRHWGQGFMQTVNHIVCIFIGKLVPGIMLQCNLTHFLNNLAWVLEKGSVKLLYIHILGSNFFFQKCGEGEHILVNITTREWECVDEATNYCPGSVEFFCPDQSIPTGE